MNAENSPPRRDRRVGATVDLPRCWLPHCDRLVTHSGEMCDRCRHAARVYPNEPAERQQGGGERGWGGRSD